MYTTTLVDLQRDNLGKSGFRYLPSRKISFHGLMGLAQDGMHWVGDLAAEYDVDIQGTSGTLSLDLVEFGIHYICDIDVASGMATLHATDRASR